jgi:hypothetical protein
MSVPAEEVEELLKRGCVPNGHMYTLVLASVTKRVLQMELSESWRLEFLGHLEKMTDEYLTSEVIAAIDPMDDRGEEIAAEIRKVGPSKALDLYAKAFVAFAALNSSLIGALKMSPRYRYLNQEAAP